MGEIYIETVIVGGGLAGAACGIELIKNNSNPCIIEKANFPRQKLCGGAITQKTIEVLKDIVPDFEVHNYTCNSSNSVDIYRFSDEIAKINTNNKFYFVERMDFDNELIKYYKKLGGNILENTKVNRIDFRNKLLYTSNNETIKFKYLVGADGANSLTRKALGLKLGNVGFCLEVDIPVNSLKRINNSIQIHFGIIKNGYGWVFPKGDYYTVGIGNKYSKSIDYKEILYKYLALLGLKNFEDIFPKGAFIPFGDAADMAKVPDNVLLAGDAAGLVDPISGEGIYFALASGKEAAKAILSNKPSKAKEYKNRSRKSLQYVKNGKVLQSIFYQPQAQKLILCFAKKNQDILRFFLDNFILFYNYSYKKIVLLPIYYCFEKLIQVDKNVDM